MATILDAETLSFNRTRETKMPKRMLSDCSKEKDKGEEFYNKCM